MFNRLHVMAKGKELMDYIIKKASELTAEEQAALGITGIPQEWPIEKFPYTDVVPPKFIFITESDLIELIYNNQAAYDAWLQSLRPLPPPITPQPVTVENTLPVPTAATSPINIHCMEPWGCVGGYYEPRGTVKYVCNVTLSNKSQDGLTFTYNSDIDITPSVGNYVFQNESMKRSWITAVDAENKTVTFELPLLEEGSGIYSKGFYMDALVRDWATTMYVWGVTFNVQEFLNGDLETDPCPDFCELSVVDHDDLFLRDDVCMAVFGVPAAEATPYLLANKFEQNGEYGHWTKYYDESWTMNFTNRYVATVDGAPAAIMPGLYLRFSFFTTEVEENKAYKIYVDYAPTSIPSGSM
jgi:hypothetical protein